jgi:hypothetical protein
LYSSPNVVRMKYLSGDRVGRTFSIRGGNCVGDPEGNVVSLRKDNIAVELVEVPV